MIFEIEREHFQSGLSHVSSIVGARSGRPILSNVLIQAESSGHVLLTTSDLELGIRCSVQAKVQAEGSITLPAHRLNEIVKKFSGSEVKFNVKKDEQVHLSCGGSRFRLPGIAADEFPPLPKFNEALECDLQQSDLSEMLKSVAYAQSKDENRYILNGVHFVFEKGGVRLVATDGRRLALVGKRVASESSGSFILPAKTVSKLQSALSHEGSAKIAFNEKQVAFEIGIPKAIKEKQGLIGHLYLVSRIVEGKYPNYQQVIPDPKEVENRIKIERELLAECIERAALVTSEKNQSIQLKIGENRLEILGESSDYGESHEAMDIAYKGTEVLIAFNPGFLLDPLRALDKDEVFFEFKDNLSPGVFKTLDDFLCVVMPLRSD